MKISRFLLLILSLIFSPLLLAQENSEVRLVFDFDTLALEDLNFDGDGGVASFNQREESIQREFSAGDRVSDVLQVGDFEETLEPQLFTLEGINEVQDEPTDFSTTSLTEFPLAGEQTVESLVQAVPDLGEERVDDVAPIAALLEGRLDDDQENATLEELINSDPTIAEMQLNETDLEEFTIDSIPNLETTTLDDLEGSEDTTISDVPGLAGVALNDFPGEITTAGNFIARIDFIWGGAESRRNRTISGSFIEGFMVPCDTNCEYLELDDIENIGRAIQLPFEGRQWIAGREHFVLGGTGCLTGLEPTGIHPFGEIFKVVLWRTDETTDTAQIALFFAISSFCGTSPYVFGPVFFPGSVVRVNDFVFIGGEN